jgi:YfiH family protein
MGVRTADCVPLLLVDPRGHRVAAVHSGWRGTHARIAARAVEALAARGSRPADLLAVVGPAIGPCCYRVSSELAEQFESAFGAEVVRRGSAPSLDLPLAVALTLTGVGVEPNRVEVMPHCTHCQPERFFSHRRDAGVTGRHLAYVTCVF